MVTPDSSNTAPLAGQWKYLILAIAIVIAYALIRQQWNIPAHGGVDENCYLVAGRQIATTGGPHINPHHQDGNPVTQFVGDNWLGQDLDGPEGRYLPKYPPGMPLLVAGAVKLANGDSAVEFAYLVSPIGYCIGLVFLYLIAQRLAGVPAAFAAMTAAMFAAPVVRMFTSPNSHGASFAFSAMACWFIVSWLSRPRVVSAIGAGAACAAAGAVRSGELALVLPLLVGAAMLVLTSRRRWLVAALPLVTWSALVGATIALQYAWTGNWSMYAASGESATFSVSKAIHHLPLALWEMLKAMGPFLPLGAAGLVILARRDPPIALALASVALANVLLYCAWWWAPANPIVIYSRLFLPAMAVLWAAGAAAITWMIPRRAIATASLWVAVVVAAMTSSPEILGFASLDVLAQMGVEERAQWLKDHVPDNAVVFCDEPDILDHLAFVSNYELYDGRMFRREDLQRLVHFDPEWPLCLDPERRRYINAHLLSRTPEQLTDLRDDLVASYARSGCRVFFFSGPERKWASFSSLSKRGLQPQFIAGGKRSLDPVPTVPQFWGLEEVVPLH